MSIDRLADVRRLMADGLKEAGISTALKITRHLARKLVLQVAAEGQSSAPIVNATETETSGEFHPLANLFPLIEGPEFDELVADIKANGLHEPVVVFERKLLDGRNRYRACLVAGVKPVLIAFQPESQGQPLEFVLSKNLKRRHLNESQRAMVAARIANLSDGQRADRSANLPSSPVTQPQAAKRLSISERALRAARSVQDHGEPELARAVDRGHLAVSAAATAAKLSPAIQRAVAAAANSGDPNAARHVIKSEAREARESSLGAAQAAGNLTLPDKKYGVILADPEWKFETWSPNGQDRSADNHYATSETAKIAARPVQGIAADDCVLFLWATAPMLPQALHVMAAWGFEYKSHAIWDKEAAGTGYWFRNCHELLLVGTRGKFPAPAQGTQPPSIFHEARGAHSVKPKIIHELIEQWFPHLPKIELNAREARSGWDNWGAEAPNKSEAAE